MIPSLFIAHGAPMLAIEDNEYTRFLSQLGKSMPRPQAIVIFSAHWEAGVQKISAVKEYETIYDFGGFPDALYQIRYPAPGNRKLAGEIEQVFSANGIVFDVDSSRGLDHGAWVVLRLLYPDADVPVVSMSVNPNLPPASQYKIGQCLSDLRKQDVLIVGSGGTVHNLRALDWQSQQPVAWAAEFDDWLGTHLQHWNLDSLFAYETLAPNARLAVPPYGKEHFAPLLYAMGAADDTRFATLLHQSYQYGSLSQSVWQFH
ncbi:dioxygenase family protein [Alicyclobacillus sp. ALC3]|uniref:dioxygenase family protein n=1 Tax=Alicyclobacillus sp. ALC3 TaxID=2796143 RepID=UPI00237801C9|nr:class III extradiol ring-cleavage dioxygenase [Alicyclobacillus sp. ALC3]WDL98318.1 dioxygenase [Alicyclobacillus sp. ALC3]